MNLSENQQIKTISQRLKESMIDFIEPDETSYDEKDVETCMNLINTFLKNLDETNSKEEGMKVVETTVLALNELNENCDGEMIETGQREDIAEIIILAGNLKGYNSLDEDITEEWREW